MDSSGQLNKVEGLSLVMASYFGRGIGLHERHWSLSGLLRCFPPILNITESHGGTDADVIVSFPVMIDDAVRLFINARHNRNGVLFRSLDSRNWSICINSIHLIHERICMNTTWLTAT